MLYVQPTAVTGTTFETRLKAIAYPTRVHLSLQWRFIFTLDSFMPMQTEAAFDRFRSGVLLVRYLSYVLGEY
jgi:hypothetical protein